VKIVRGLAICRTSLEIKGIDNRKKTWYRSEMIDLFCPNPIEEKKGLHPLEYRAPRSRPAVLLGVIFRAGWPICARSPLDRSSYSRTDRCKEMALFDCYLPDIDATLSDWERRNFFCCWLCFRWVQTERVFSVWFPCIAVFPALLRPVVAQTGSVQAVKKRHNDGFFFR
jgi:hypothetical protein